MKNIYPTTGYFTNVLDSLTQRGLQERTWGSTFPLSFFFSERRKKEEETVTNGKHRRIS